MSSFIIWLSNPVLLEYHEMRNKIEDKLNLKIYDVSGLNYKKSTKWNDIVR